jgi:hypothetical protein
MSSSHLAPSDLSLLTHENSEIKFEICFLMGNFNITDKQWMMKHIIQSRAIDAFIDAVMFNHKTDFGVGAGVANIVCR